MKITFILKDGSEKNCDFMDGDTILKIAEKKEIPIKSFCEGFGVCGACHVIVENLHDKLPPISDKENDALDGASGVTMHSRLACQIVLTKKLDGLRVRLT